MVQGACEKLQSGPDGVEQLEVQPYVMRKGPYHPSDADLLEDALGEHDTADGSDIEGHLSDCLYCRIRLNRIKISDPRLEPPAYAVQPAPVSDETLELLAANPSPKVEAGQVWLAQGDHGQLMVWIGRLRSDTDAAWAYPVTPNIDAVDDNALIVELPNVGPVGVVSSLYGSVDISRLVAHLGGLDIYSDLRRLDEAARNGTRTDLRTGRPITDPADERHEFDQFLIDQLADLDPIIESADEDDDMLADGWEPGLVFAIPGSCHSRHPSESDLLGYALDELDGPAGADVQAHLADCLFCRIRINRMRRCDPRLEPPRHAPTRPQISEEILRPLAADPADKRNEFLHMLADDLAALDQQCDTPVLAEATAAAKPGTK